MSNIIPFEKRELYLKKLDHKNQVRFALRCAKSVAQNPAGARCIEVVELWLDGRASAEECRQAAYAAADAADAAAYAAYAAYAADAAACAAAYAADAADAIKKDLMRYLWELVNVDSVIYETILKVT